MAHPEVAYGNERLSDRTYLGRFRVPELLSISRVVPCFSAALASEATLWFLIHGGHARVFNTWVF